MVKVKPRETIRRNYRSSASEAQKRYGEAIDTIEWQAAAVAGQDLYETRMMDPDVLARRASEIAKVTDTEFRQAMKDKGAKVLSSRMQAATPAYIQGFEPYRQALEGVTLPPRDVDPMVNIDNRLKPVVQALVDTKEAQG